ALYSLFGALFLVAGASALLVNTELLPEVLKNFVVEESGGDLHTLHIMQEVGSLLVFVGLMLWWQLRCDQLSPFFDWFMTAFWGLIALVHWFDVRGPRTSMTGPLITTIPFVLFTLVGLIPLAIGARRGISPEPNQARSESFDY